MRVADVNAHRAGEPARPFGGQFRAGYHRAAGLDESLGDLHVLYVDGGSASDAVPDALRAAGAAVTVAASQADARELFSGLLPDVLIVAFEPGEDPAVELVSFIRTLPRDAGGLTPVVGLHSGGPEAERAMSAGVQVCLRRPVGAEELVGNIARLREQARSVREHRQRIRLYTEARSAAKDECDEPAADGGLEPAEPPPLVQGSGARQNLLLAWAEARGEVALPLLDLVAFRKGQEVVPDRSDTVYFPVDAALSVSVLLRDGASLSVALVGCDGTLRLGHAFDGYRVVAEVAGTAYRLSLDHLTGSRGQYLRQAAALSAELLFVRAARTAACLGRHGFGERIASWALELSDVTSDDLSVTQVAIARALGMRRQCVNEEITKLARAGALEGVGRGHLRVRDRARLAAAACECYAASRAAKLALWQHLSAL